MLSRSKFKALDPHPARVCVWCPQTALVWENPYTLSRRRNHWNRPPQTMLFMLPSQSTGLWSVLTLLWTVSKNTQGGTTAPSIIWTLRQMWVSSHCHEMSVPSPGLHLGGGGARGVIRPPPRIWQIHLYCYNSDVFVPPTFLICPIHLPLI